MAVTQNIYTGDGTTVLFSFTFPYLETTDIKVSLNGTVTTAYTLANATTIQFNTAPANGAAIRIYRETDDSALAATFYPGSAIRSQDLNDNFTQNLYVTQESSNTATTATTTANSAVTTANTALSNSTTAISTANSASASAASAVSTATQAASDAASAVSTATTASATATQASTDAAAAVSTANTAASQVAGAVSTANSAAADAASALSASAAATATANSALSTANTASSNASAAVSTANTANTNATAALNAVANSVQYTLVANVAAIPGSPADGDAIEIADSTGVESFTPLANIPAGYVGDVGLSVRIQYSSAGSTWNWLNYFPNNAESRYLKLAGGTLTGALTLNADPTQNLQAATKQYVDNVANSGGLPLTGGTMTGQILGDNSTSPTTPGYAFDGDPNTGLYTTGADELALATGGTARLTIDPAGAVAITNSLSVGGQAAVVTNDARLTDTRTPTDGTVTDAKVAANAAIAGTKVSPNFGSQNISTTGTITTGAITLPNTDGTNGQVLSTNGSGTLSWTTAAAGGASVTTSDTAPSSPSDGDLWYDSAGGRTYVYYEDANSSQWVDASPQGGGGGSTTLDGLSDVTITTPSNGQVLSYDGSGWVNSTPAGGGGDIISEGNTSAEVIDTGSDGRFVVTTEGTERARIDSSGRLLVGTSTSVDSDDGYQPSIQVAGVAAKAALSIARYQANNPYGAQLFLQRSKTDTIGSQAIMSSGDEIGLIQFEGSDGTKFRRAAGISAQVDGTPGANDMPGRLVFSTTADGASSPTERMRITNNGFLKATSDGTYADIDPNTHGFRNTYSGQFAISGIQTSANPYGLRIYYPTVLNGNVNDFFYFHDAGAIRARMKSNGGLANYSANDANLSDRNAKKDISPAADTWDCIKEWEIVNYRYKDQPDDADLNLGVIAQQVAEICPEVITVFSEATEDQPEKLGVKEQQMYWMAIKALQEAQVRIETLEAQNASQAATIAAIEARLTALEGGTP